MDAPARRPTGRNRPAAPSHGPNPDRRRDPGSIFRSAGTIDRSFDHWPHRRTAQAEKTESDSGISPLAALGTRLTLRLAPTAPRPSHPPPPPQPAPTAAPDTAAVFSCVPLDADTRPRAIASWVHCAPARTTRSRPHAPLRAGTARTHLRTARTPIGAPRDTRAPHEPDTGSGFPAGPRNLAVTPANGDVRPCRSRLHAALRPGRARTPTGTAQTPIGAPRPAQARHDGVRPGSPNRNRFPASTSLRNLDDTAATAIVPPDPRRRQERVAPAGTRRPSPARKLRYRTRGGRQPRRPPRLPYSTGFPSRNSPS